jgi:hypothetical protein
MVCLIPCFICKLILFFLYCVHVFGFGVRSMTPLSFGSFSFYLLAVSFSFFIYCLYAFEFKARSTTPLSFGSFFFYICWLFFLLFSYIVHMLNYQNQCYMCTKISVIQWLASSGGLVFRKNSCSLDVILVMACSSRTACWDFVPRCWEFKFLT